MAEINIEFTPKQQKLWDIVSDMNNPVRFPGYGGAKGGGKSYFVRTFQCIRRLLYAKTSGLIVRRTLNELEKNHVRNIQKEWPETVYEFKDQKHQFRFRNGSVVDFAYVETEKDLERLQGSEYEDICLDEAEHHEKQVFKVLRTNNRTTRKDLKPCVINTFNWGGIGHKWLKKMYWRESFRPNANEVQQQDTWENPLHWDDGENPKQFYFLQAFWHDNPHLNNEYCSDLDALPEKLRKAWRDGDPDVYEGQFFPEFGLHLREKPFVIPPHVCNLYGSLDYGEGEGDNASATSFGLWHVDIDGRPHRLLSYYQRHKTASTYAREILGECQSFHYTSGKYPKVIYADPSIWIKRRLDDNFSHSVADIMNQYFVPVGVKLEKANNNRVQGWRVMREHLTSKDGVPNSFYWDGYNEPYELYVPTLAHAKHNKDDVQKAGEDHVGDEARYFFVAAMGLGDLARRQLEDDYTRDLEYRKLNQSCELAMVGNGSYDTGWR